MSANARLYGLANPSAELRERKQHTDEQGVTHIRFDQLHRGLPVFEGEAIAHVAGDDVTVTNSLAPYLNVNTGPGLNRNEAMNTVLRYISPVADYQVRDVSQWILPRGAHSVADRLVWQVAVFVANDFEEFAYWRYFIDAQTGAVLFSFNGLQTAGKPGGGGGTPYSGHSGRTMYSGDQPIDTTQQSTNNWLLRDPFRPAANGGNYACDLGNSQFLSSPCPTFSRPTNVFGNGLKDNSDRATAGADAAFGLQWTWNYYASMFGRNGINNAGRQTFSRVHIGRSYENAFWDDGCFCMNYGDGASTFYPLVSVDVAGHEMSHGVMASEANLTYAGESGGLNESNSDIFGTLVEHYASAHTTANPDSPDYWIGERIYKGNYSRKGDVYTQNAALRYMDDPSRDGASPACWSSSIGGLNVHYSSGPNNHMFYLLSHGGTSKCTGNTVNGIGNEKAARIWYKAVTDFLTADDGYAEARQAALDAAAQLYGAASAETSAVAAAYSAINVN